MKCDRCGLILRYLWHFLPDNPVALLNAAAFAQAVSRWRGASLVRYSQVARRGLRVNKGGGMSGKYENDDTKMMIRKR